MAKKAPEKKKPVSKGQATAVANMLKSQKAGGNGGTNVPPSAKSNPVVDDDDDVDTQGA